MMNREQEEMTSQWRPSLEAATPSRVKTRCLCCWCAAHENTHFSEAMWLTVAGLGDRDTTCAIVGGIVGAKLDAPDEWRARRESLPDF
jgi:hypothetical protein